MGVTVQAVADALNKRGLGGQLAEVMAYRPVGFEFPINIGGRNKTAKIVENHNPWEDDFTQRVWFTIQVGEQYFRRYGMYLSHVGTDWEYGQTEEVFPQTRVIVGFSPA